jgi:hypothetical protein
MLTMNDTEKDKVLINIKHPISKINTFDIKLYNHDLAEFELTSEQEKQLLSQGHIHLENDEKIIDIHLKFLDDNLMRDESIDALIDNFINNASDDKELDEFKINGYDYCKSPVANNGRLTETEASRYLMDFMQTEQVISLELCYPND